MSPRKSKRWWWETYVGGSSATREAINRWLRAHPTPTPGGTIEHVYEHRHEIFPEGDPRAEPSEETEATRREVGRQVLDTVDPDDGLLRASERLYCPACGAWTLYGMAHAIDHDEDCAILDVFGVPDESRPHREEMSR